MGKTIIEKILAKASKEKKVCAGDRVWASIDLVSIRDFGGVNAVLEYEENFGNRKIFDKNKFVITFDLYAPPRDEKVAKNQKICKEFLKKQGGRLFDVDCGIGAHVLLESGLVKPWDIVLGTDSHMNLLGAICAFGSGVGATDLTAALAYGKLWFRVPETHKYIIKGDFAKGIGEKDLILKILKEKKTDGAIYKAIEFYGDVINKMNLSKRITLTSMVTELSGKIGFIEPNEEIIDELGKRGVVGKSRIFADADANYEKEEKFSVPDEPLIACPHSPDNVKPVSEVEGLEIDQVFIGSCTNGRYEDMEAAAKILKKRKIKNGIRLIIVPATKEVAINCIQNGLYETFIKAGAIIGNPSCALCTIGHPGVLAPGERMVSTSNRNFPDKIGKGGEIYLASPLTAAASAIRGAIADPREFLEGI
ncbi:MAG: aconitase/3-isopropylmalate dehydratase large subunit family protein [Candidatus Thermoplasmatota archaeon]